MDVRLRGRHLRALQTLSTARRLCRPTVVPIAPGDAPMTPAGMWLKELLRCVASHRPEVDN